MTASVDVFIPNYNYAGMLRQTIDSVLAQEGVDVRVLVVDNASTDSSVDVVEEVMAADKRVRLLRHSENLGLIASLNDGLEWAEAKYTVSLSSDDLLAEGWLERAARALDAYPSAAFAFGPARLFSSWVPGGRAGRRSSTILHAGSHFIASSCATRTNKIRAPEGVMRTETVRRTGAFNPALPYCSDMEMWLRLASRGDAVEITGPVAAYYRMHGKNMSTGSHLDLLSDLMYPLDAIDSWYAVDGDKVPGSAAMVEAARRQTANEALDRARVAFLVAPDNPESDLFERLLTLAAGLDPGVAHRAERMREHADSPRSRAARDALLPASRLGVRTRRRAVAARIRWGLT